MVNQTFSLSDSRQIRFPRAGNSANQISRGCKLSPSGFERLSVRPIRFRGVGSSANRMFSVFRWCPIRFFRTGRSGYQREGPYFIISEKLLFSFLHLDLWLVEKGHHLEVLFRNMGAASREWRPGWAPTND